MAALRRRGRRGRRHPFDRGWSTASTRGLSLPYLTLDAWSCSTGTPCPNLARDTARRREPSRTCLLRRYGPTASVGDVAHAPVVRMRTSPSETDRRSLGMTLSSVGSNRPAARGGWAADVDSGSVACRRVHTPRRTDPGRGRREDASAPDGVSGAGGREFLDRSGRRRLPDMVPAPWSWRPDMVGRHGRDKELGGREADRAGSKSGVARTVDGCGLPRAVRDGRAYRYGARGAGAGGHERGVPVRDQGVEGDRAVRDRRAVPGAGARRRTAARWQAVHVLRGEHLDSRACAGARVVAHRGPGLLSRVCVRRLSGRRGRDVEDVQGDHAVGCRARVCACVGAG